jgi:periplasmic protein TonB
MCTRYALFLFLALAFLIGPSAAVRGQQSNETSRKVLRKVEPQYPATAKKMNLGGTVRIVASIASDGNVKKVEAVGGSPLLIQAAVSAVSQWRFAPGGESTETVELHFTPLIDR